MQKKTTTPEITTAGNEDIECNLCEGRAWLGPKCTKCPGYRKHHYSVGHGKKPADFFVVCTSPDLHGPSSNTTNHSAWTGAVEKLVRDQINRVNKKANFAPDNLIGCYTYAVRCEIEKPTKKYVESCRPLLLEYLQAYSHPQKDLVILALGKEVLQALKIPVKKYKDIQGRILEVTIAGRKAFVIPTTSKRQLMAKTGFFAVAEHHIAQTLKTAQQVKHRSSITVASEQPELEANYHYPQTLNEVSDLVDHVLAYHTPETTVDNHHISIDTETNTLHPHRKKLKILSVIVGWDRGHAMSIGVEHPDTPWSLAEVRPYIQALLNSDKPKVFQNAKYDIKVLKAKGFKIRRLSWDTMLGEHLLEEDKAGYYGLKQLTKDYFPQFAGYEDEVKDIVDRVEAGNKNAVKTTHLKGAAKKLAEDDGYASIPLDKLHKYGCIDGDITLRLFYNQWHRTRLEDIKLANRRKDIRQMTNQSRRFKHLYEPECPISAPLVSLMHSRALPVTKALADMELHGMAVDRDYTLKLAETMDIATLAFKDQLNQMIHPGSFPADAPFNPNSPAQVAKILFNLGYVHPETGEVVSYHGRIADEDIPRTEKGAISLNAKFLRYLRNQYDCPLSAKLLDYRAVTKARSTFVENISVLSREDGRMHTTFHIPGTATGRLSSSGENMQNIPFFILEHNIKKMFVAAYPGNVIVDSDAKAAEVRIYAAYSKDKNLIAALNEGLDPHSFFAATVYNPDTVLKGVPAKNKKHVLATIGIDDEHGWTYEDFQNRGTLNAYGKRLEKLRKNIKRVVFGILYGAGKTKIGGVVGIPDEQAQAIISVLFQMFPSIQTYIDQTHDQVKELGLVETFIGRKRRFNDYNQMPYGLKARAERQAVNFKIQSTSSDIVMDVLCSVYNPIKRDLGGQPLITVHDSIVFEVPKHYVSQVPDLIHHHGVKRVAEKYPWLPVPFQWDTEVGPSYGELQTVESYLANTSGDTTRDQTDYEELEIREELKAV